jgi:hypothetical protein
MWSFDGLTWTQATAGSGPGARTAMNMTYDAQSKRVVLFGGADVGGMHNDVWLWNGQQWSNPIPATSPPARESASLGYDVARHKVVMFGGFDPTQAMPFYDDTWEWDGTTWASGPKQPGARLSAAMTYDPSASAMMPVRVYNSLLYVGASARTLSYGGQVILGNAYGDTWQWDGTSWQPVLTVDAPPARCQHVVFPSRDGAGMLVFGGNTGQCSSGVASLSDLWELRMVSATPDELCDANVDNDGDGLAGCADPDCWATCTPLCPPGTTCNPSDPHCGDGTCDPERENCRNCPQDCTTCAAACGDTFCDPGETSATCPGDCP